MSDSEKVASRDWRMPRRDRSLSNRSQLTITPEGAPRELWQLDTRAWGGEIELAADEQRRERVTSLAPAESAGEDKGAGNWRRRTFDVAGNGTPVPAPEGNWGQLIPGVRGLQRVAWSPTAGDSAKLQCFSYENGLGQPKLVWESEEQGTVQSPLVLLADVDGDGKTEVVSAMHYRILIFDGATGKLLHKIRYHNLRNYGYFGLFFNPGDPFAKFVNISDFANHFDVVDFNGEALNVAFRRDVEGADGGGIAGKRKILRPGPNPLEDIDGDQKPELTFNFFNDEGDERWHVVAYEPMTGSVKLNLKDHYLVGLYDVDGDGAAELFCQSVTDRHTSGWHTLRALKLQEGRIKTLYETRNARFGTFNLRFLPPASDTGAAGGRATVAAGHIGAHGERGFVVLRPGPDGRAVQAESYNRLDSRYEKGWSVAAPPGGAVAVSCVEGREPVGLGGPAAGTASRVVLSVSARAEDSEITAERAGVRLATWGPRSTVSTAPIVVSDRGETVLITETSSQTIAAYTLERGSGKPKLLWERPGRGMATGGGEADGGLAAGDLDGDGRPELVFAHHDAKSGAAALVAMDLKGRILWEHPFPGYDSERPEWNLGGLTLWTLAHLTDARRLDVYANTRRSTMHSDVSFALDGRTGRQIWTGDKVPVGNDPPWGFGGAYVATHDVLGNGLEQIVSEYPICYYVVDGRNGKIVHTVDLTAKTLPGWAGYGVPVVADFIGDGAHQVLVPTQWAYGLLTLEGRPLWGAGTEHLISQAGPGASGPAAGDFDGDGALEVVRLFDNQVLLDKSKAGNRIELIDGATGKLKAQPFYQPDLKWQAPVVVDADGDGVDELVLRIAANTLGALKLNRKDGAVDLLWQVNLPGEPYRSIVADINGDGDGELVVSCTNGAVVAFGK